MKTVVGEDWKAREEDLDAISAARNSDPFAVSVGIGLLRDGLFGSLRLRRFPRARDRDGALIAELSRRRGDIFEALIPSAKERPVYRVEVTTAHGSYS